MKIIREYDDPELVLEFEPNLSARPVGKGNLIAAAYDSEGEEQTFSGRLNVAERKDRLQFIRDAHELLPDAFPDEFGFNRALNDLFIAVDEEITALEAEVASGEDGGEEIPDDPCEEYAPRQDEHPERYKAAMEILTSTDVLEEAAKVMKLLGHVGETNNKKIAFSCACSARAGLPVQPSTHAESAAGKNFLWDTVLSLLPQEIILKRTGFSAKALFRTQMKLKGSVLYIQEVAGTEGADFSIRTLQSDGALVWEATEKAPDGTMVNVEHRVEGPCVIVQTTTRNHLHPENETRVVPIYLDDSAEQTERITKAELARAAGKGSLSPEKREELLTPWRDAVRLLQPAEVVIPYAERIRVPATPLRLRRDVPRLLNIIRLIAWFHQFTRERDDAERILATEKDFNLAKAMVGLSFERAWKNLTPTEEKVYRACKDVDESKRRGFKRSHVEGKLKEKKEDIPSRTVNQCLTSLATNGYLDSDHKRGAEGATYTFATKSISVGTIELAPELTLVSDDVESEVVEGEVETPEIPETQKKSEKTQEPEDGLAEVDEKNSHTPLANLPIDEKSGESGLEITGSIGKSDFANSCQLPIDEGAFEGVPGRRPDADTVADENTASPVDDAASADEDDEREGNGRIGKNWQKATCLLKTHSNAGKVPNRQLAKDSVEKKFNVATDDAGVQEIADAVLGDEEDE